MPVLLLVTGKQASTSIYSLINASRTVRQKTTPSLNHVLIVIFLEFFSWGLLTVPVINVLSETFPSNKFLMNGLILGVKGILSFLCAPLIGALSDKWGRKYFLILTVFFTCLPIPFLKVSPWWYFALFSVSGVFSVTFSVVLAYVADITEPEERNFAYGLVSATFGASLIVSPALGAYVGESWSDELVVALATVVASLDILIILLYVPESLAESLRPARLPVSWESADPFASLRLVGQDSTVMLLCVVVFLSYLPEAGQFSCFFVYLKLIVGFSPDAVGLFIGLIGMLSVLAQTLVLVVLQKACGPKETIMFGLTFQFIQLLWYGFYSDHWMMWVAGFFAALSQITYPSVSSFLSLHCDGDKQGTAQGMLAGIRGLCQGLGPALFGLIFYVFNVDLNSADRSSSSIFTYSRQSNNIHQSTVLDTVQNRSSPASAAAVSLVEKSGVAGPPFIVGALLVLLALFAVRWLQSVPHFRNMPSKVIRLSSEVKRQSLSYRPLVIQNSHSEVFVPRSRVSPSTLSALRGTPDNLVKPTVNDF